MNAMTTQVNGGSIGPIKNVAACRALVETLINCPPHVPNMGVYSGFSGYGKTLAATYSRNATDAIMIEVFDSWSRRTFCEALLEELGVAAPRGTIATMMKAIVERLGNDPSRLLIIDEAHTAIKRGMVELIREINKLAKVPILLVGEEKLPEALEPYENANNLVLETVFAQPCDLDDTKVLARLFYPRLKIADDLLAAVSRETGGRARRIVSTLHAIGVHAVNFGLVEVDAASYRGRIFTGARPVRNSRAA